jgi:carbonic anhydrase
MNHASSNAKLAGKTTMSQANVGAARLAFVRLKLQVFKACLKPQDERIASVLTELALIQRARGASAEAQKHWTEARAIRAASGAKAPGFSLGMQHLIDGVRRFQTEILPGEKQLFEELSHGQHPEVLFITCSDSRIETSHLTQVMPGELFILRNVGHIVPPHGTEAGGEEASIEFAVNAINVKDIIICGHSHCGAMKGLLHPESLANLPAVKSFLTNAQETLDAVANLPPGLSEDERLERTVEANVLVQMNHLKKLPSVAQAISEGKVNVHGWVYEIESGVVRYFDADSNSWQSV